MNNIIIEHHHQDTDYDDHGHLEEVSIAKGGWEAENEISFWMFRDWLQDRTWICHFIVFFISFIKNTHRQRLSNAWVSPPQIGPGGGEI